MTDYKAVYHYTGELLMDCLERARNAKSRYKKSKSEFDSGYSIAYYEVISMAFNRLEAFLLAPNDVGLRNISDPEELLEDLG